MCVCVSGACHGDLTETAQPLHLNIRVWGVISPQQHCAGAKSVQPFLWKLSAAPHPAAQPASHACAPAPQPIRLPVLLRHTTCSHLLLSPVSTTVPETAVAGCCTLPELFPELIDAMHRMVACGMCHGHKRAGQGRAGQAGQRRAGQQT